MSRFMHYIPRQASKLKQANLPKLETEMTARKTAETSVKEFNDNLANASPELKQVAIETLQSTGKEEFVETVQEAQVDTKAEEMSGVKIICNDCDGLSADEIKVVIEYCSNRIDELQRKEVEALEAEMRAIKGKLISMRGFRLKSGTANGNTRVKRTDSPLINPKNPTQVYTFGKTPEWLSKWMIETGKTVAQLREAQAQQSKEEVKAQ